MLDAANYAKEGCDIVTDKTIKNAFTKADFSISLDSAVTETLTVINFLSFIRISTLQPQCKILINL